MSTTLRGRRDLGEAGIVSALTRVGASVDYAERRPYDLVVGYRGQTYLLEVKGPKGKPRHSQQAFLALWCGHYAIVRTPREALIAIEALPQAHTA